MPFTFQKSPKNQKNLFASKKKQILTEKGGSRKVSSTRQTPKSLLLGSSTREHKSLSPLALKSLDFSKRRCAEDRDDGDDSVQLDVSDASREDENQVQDESESEDDWYEGKTLVAKLNLSKESHETDDPSRKLAVVNDLKEAFDAHGEALRSELTLPLVAALDHVSQTHAIIEGTVDEDLKRGLITFAEASETSHELRMKVKTHLKSSLDENQNTVKALFFKLQQAYQKREALWQELNGSLDECGEQALSIFANLETNLKRAETLLDKRCRVLSHEASGATGRQGVLKSFLDRL